MSKLKNAVVNNTCPAVVVRVNKNETFKKEKDR